MFDSPKPALSYGQIEIFLHCLALPVIFRQAQYSFRTGGLSADRQLCLNDDFAICLCPQGASSMSPGLVSQRLDSPGVIKSKVPTPRDCWRLVQVQIVPTLRVGTCFGRSASSEAASAAAGMLPRGAWEQEVCLNALVPRIYRLDF